MDKGVIKTIFKLEVKRMFMMKEVVRINVLLIGIYLCISEIVSKNSLMGDNFAGFYKVSFFISSLSSLWMILFGTILMRINLKKNKSININSIIKLSNYIKWGILSTMFYQLAFVCTTLFDIQSNFMEIFGTLMFLNLYVNVLFGMKYISSSTLFVD